MRNMIKKFLIMSFLSLCYCFPTLHDLVNNFDDMNWGYSHWKQYCTSYEKNFEKLRLSALVQKREVRMLEIGVQNGGSMVLWRQYFGESLYYVGFDIQDPIKQLENITINQYIEIGDQNDIEFQKEVCKKHGPFHIIIDDGGHHTEQMMKSLIALWGTEGCLLNETIYAIEDLHGIQQSPWWTYNDHDLYYWLGNFTRSISLHAVGRSVSNELAPAVMGIKEHLRRVEIYDSLAYLYYQKDPMPMYGRTVEAASSINRIRNTSVAAFASVYPQDKLDSRPTMSDLYLKHNSAKHLLPYGKPYDEVLLQLRKQSTPVKVLLIGLRRAGLERMNVWSEYFGISVILVGLERGDFTKKMKQDVKVNFEMITGNPVNVTFVHNICNRLGPFDVIVDGGFSLYTSLTMRIVNAFWHGRNCLSDKAVYAIEDLLSKKVVGGRSDTDMFATTTAIGRNMTAYFGPIKKIDAFSSHLSWLDIYPNIAFFHYQTALAEHLEPVSKGNRMINFIPWEKLGDYKEEQKKKKRSKDKGMKLKSL